MNKEKILDFIRRRFAEDNHWADGNCFWAAAILTLQFRDLAIFYQPVPGHFVAGDPAGTHFFDASGEVELKPGDPRPTPLAWIYDHDRTWFDRLMRDCRD